MNEVEEAALPAIAPDSALTTELITRSSVPAGLAYTKYRKYLRYDFFCSCAYCSITEAEAQAIRFTIDHYYPQTARTDLVNEYANLMYACDECNTRKGDRCPPPEAEAAGTRFFRADVDRRVDHFVLNGVRLEAKSNIGDFTIAALDLNRQSLRRLREIRCRLIACERYAADGIAALRSFHIDRLPPRLKAQAKFSIDHAKRTAESMTEIVESLLRDFARSQLDDFEEDPELESRTAERLARLKAIQGLHPGNWRGRSKGKGKITTNTGRRRPKQ